MRIDNLHNEFLAYLELERDYSPHTISSYRSDFRSFLQFLASEGVLPELDQVDRSTVRRYLAWLHDRGVSSATIVRRIDSLRSFWNYLRESEYTESDPFFRISVRKRPARTPTHLSLEEAQGLLAAAGRQGSLFNAFRDTAVLTVLLCTGIRRSELLSLTLDALDLDGGTLQVTAGKGSKSRVLPLLPAACTALADWLELRPDCGHDRVFTSKWGAPLSTNGLSSLLKRALGASGITKSGITLHSLRHTFACLLLKSGCDLYSLQRMLGHSRLDTTAVYLHATVEDLRAAAAKHPLNQLGSEAH